MKSRSPKRRWFLGGLAVLLMILTGLALLDYRSYQDPLVGTEVTDTNIIGEFGVIFANRAFGFLGLAAYTLPLLLMWGAYVCFTGRGWLFRVNKLLGAVGIVSGVAVLGTLLQVELLHHGVLTPPEALEVQIESREDLQIGREGERRRGPSAAELVASNQFSSGYGGTVGYYVYQGLFLRMLNWVGSLVVFGLVTLAGLVSLLHDNLLRVATRWVAALPARRRESVAAAKKLKAKRAKEKQLAKKEAQKRRQMEAEKKKAEAQRKKEEAVSRKQAAAKAKAAAKQEENAPEEPADSEPFEPVPAPPPQPKATSRSLGESKSKSAIPFTPMVDAEPEAEEPSETPAPSSSTSTSDIPPPASRKMALKPREIMDAAEVEPGLRIVASEEPRRAANPAPTNRGAYEFPDRDLLRKPMPAEAGGEESYEETAELLVQTLEEFGVKVTMGEVHTGPVITRYDVFPAPGVRVEKIVSLDKNIALGLKALSVRILAPVPGKGCVGIEVPNSNRSPVVIRDILDSVDWAETKAEIPIALGKEVSGKPLIADLTKMPHLLIAGSTGSGKTVCINAIITSLLYHSGPEDVRFVMVDPKIVEMQVYNVLPHMLIPVVTDPKKVPNALKYLLGEMERRYQSFAKVGVRNIAGYNAKMAKDKASKAEAEKRAAEMDAALTPEERAAAATAIEVPRELDFEEELPEKLPYIVCIVDELADLMMVAPADIETGIARLAQLARAAGIHLILATQRPSVNVITGVIKANLPSRIAFKVASKVDSRTILDAMGADQLIGKGDMLFLPPGSPDLLRSQGAFVDDDEIAKLVEVVAERNGGPEIDETFRRSVEEGEDESSAPGAEGEYDDPMVPQAIEVIRTSKRASTSMLQRRLKIGYNRAARIMEILEDEGMVGPENGSSPREILFDID